MSDRWSTKSVALHESLVFALVALIARHVGGVIVQELRGGGALRRMLPRSGA